MRFASVFKPTTLLFTLLLVVSCGGKQTSQTEQPQAQTVPVAKLQKKYNNLYVSPFTATPEINRDYPQAAKDLQYSLTTALQMSQSFNQVSAGKAKQQAGSDTLIIKAEINDMRIVSSSARMWGGAFAGSSGIEFDLQLIDGASGKMVRKKHMSSWNNAFGAAWTGGASDNSLLDDMGKITAQYIVDSIPAN